jgi:hypothetical protein
MARRGDLLNKRARETRAEDHAHPKHRGARVAQERTASVSEKDYRKIRKDALTEPRLMD